MKTLAKVLHEAEELRARCTERTFWKYHKLRLLPERQKLPGKGNTAYFPDDTPLRLWLIHFLATQLEFSLSDISRYPWSQFEAPQVASPGHTIPGELMLEARNRYDREKDKIVRQIIEQLMKQWESGAETGHRFNGWNAGSGPLK